MIRGSCHCGAVSWTFEGVPDGATACNCTVCRRYGVLWAYYRAATVRVEAEPEAVHRYSWGPKSQYFVRCATCGCIMCWQLISPNPDRTGVNARNFEPEVLRSIRVVPLDGASF